MSEEVSEEVKKIDEIMDVLMDETEKIKNTVNQINHAITTLLSDVKPLLYSSELDIEKKFYFSSQIFRELEGKEYKLPYFSDANLEIRRCKVSEISAEISKGVFNIRFGFEECFQSSFILRIAREENLSGETAVLYYLNLILNSDLYISILEEIKKELEWEMNYIEKVLIAVRKLQMIT